MFPGEKNAAIMYIVYTHMWAVVMGTSKARIALVVPNAADAAVQTFIWLFLISSICIEFGIAIAEFLKNYKLCFVLR